MLPVRLLAASAAVFCFSACALPITMPGLPEPASSASVSDEDDADDPDAEETSSDESDGGAATAPTADWTPIDTSGIASHGAESKECVAATALTKAASPLGLSAATSGITQEMYDKVFIPSIVNDIPGDAGKPLGALEDATKALIGVEVLSSDAQIDTWTYALLDWQYVMLQICT